jgi:hypothetical protein
MKFVLIFFNIFSYLCMYGISVCMHSSVLCYLALFVFVMCLIVYPMLLGSLDCTFLIFPSVFLTFIYLIDHNKGLWSINMYTQISMQTVLSNGHCIHTLFPYIHKYEKILKKIKTNFIYSIKNVQSREPSNIGYTIRHMTKTNKAK